eukprot:SAG11_NODE_1106_length_5841_cov_44.770986_8_plen_107_part_00
MGGPVIRIREGGIERDREGPGGGRQAREGEGESVIRPTVRDEPAADKAGGSGDNDGRPRLQLVLAPLVVPGRDPRAAARGLGLRRLGRQHVRAEPREPVRHFEIGR